MMTLNRPGGGDLILPMGVYLKYLPDWAARAVAFSRLAADSQIDGISLTAGGPLAITSRGRTVALDAGGRECSPGSGLTVSPRDITMCADCLCRGSLHSQSGNISNGFVIAPEGFRVGVCGSALFSQGKFILDGITSLDFRISRWLSEVPRAITDFIAESPGEGVLVYSPPAGGKTTLLRVMAALLSRGGAGLEPKRVALVDERRELYIESRMAGGFLDVLSGYPKALGIEQATRNLNPQFIVCDEIGADENSAILAAQNCGVPLIASAHAGSLEQLRRRPGHALLLDAGVFGLAAGIGINAAGRFICDAARV